MRTREEAAELYMAIYSKFSRLKKRRFACFEGQKLFRFGNAWRRNSFNGTKVVILEDNDKKLFIV